MADVTTHSTTTFVGADMKFCSGCGSQVHKSAAACPKCGAKQRSSSGRNRIVAALFAIFLGGFGAHKFYLGQVGWGIAYLVFCWTLIPAIAAFVEFIMLLATSDDRFDERFN
jgi:TM2 domain-containing membrane protein YozV